MSTEFIAAIELGSSKIIGAVGEKKKNSDGSSIQILAYAQEDSSAFIRKGVIFNLDQTTQSLISIIGKLENEIKSSIAKVYVGIGGQSLHTVRNAVSRRMDSEVLISDELINSIGDENTSTVLTDMDILEVVPQEFKIGNNLQINPVGLVGSSIEGRFLNIIARSSIRKNLEHCFQKANIEIAELLISPLATANAVLTENERRSGCALIDFGADTTTISIYKGGILRFLSVLPLGGNSITRDLTTLKIEEEEAERLKRMYGDLLYEEDPKLDPVTCELENDNRSIKLAELNNIIEARAQEIVANVWNQIRISNYEDNLFAGIVITGGTANLKQLDEKLRKESKIKKIQIARIPRCTQIDADNILREDGTQNTIFGLLLKGDQNCRKETVAPTFTQKTESSGVPQTADMFADDLALQEEKERIAKAIREQEEKERKRKEEEKKKKVKEPKQPKENWFKKKIEQMTTIFNDNDEDGKLE